MSVRFYMDVHIRRAVTAALRLRAIDVLTAQEDGVSELDDAALLQRATDLRHVLVSQDADLLEAARRLEAGRTFSGLVYAHPLRVTIGQTVRDLELVAKVSSPEEWQGRIEYLPLG